VLCVLPLIHSRLSSLEIMALVGDVIAADARLNMWACEVMNSRRGTVDTWMEIVNFFSTAEDECKAAVQKFNEGSCRGTCRSSAADHGQVITRSGRRLER
jgi:hypothetical protein